MISAIAAPSFMRFSPDMARRFIPADLACSWNRILCLGKAAAVAGSGSADMRLPVTGGASARRALGEGPGMICRRKSTPPGNITRSGAIHYGRCGNITSAAEVMGSQGVVIADSAVWVRNLRMHLHPLPFACTARREALMKAMRILMLGSAAGLLMGGDAEAADLPVKAKAVEYVKICSGYGAGFFYIPGTDTCIKLGGYMRADVTFNAGGAHGPRSGDGGPG